LNSILEEGWSGPSWWGAGSKRPDP
jgi:hypothetical protein